VFRTEMTPKYFMQQQHAKVEGDGIWNAIHKLPPLL